MSHECRRQSSAAGALDLDVVAVVYVVDGVVIAVVVVGDVAVVVVDDLVAVMRVEDEDLDWWMCSV